MQRLALFTLLLLIGAALAPAAAVAQAAPAASATCNFNDQKQLVVEYQPVTVNLKKPLATQVPMGRVWAPGGKSMTLFTNTPVQIGSHELAVGAYTMFVLPTPKQWTLIVSKSTDTSGAYDEKDDLARVTMDSGELPTPEPTLNLSFAHAAPNQCNIRIDLDKYGRFVAFMAK